MNNKKIFRNALLCATLIMIFMVQIVSAAGGFTVEVSDAYKDKITISGSSDTANEGDAITILVLNPGYTAADAKVSPQDAIQHQWVVSAEAGGSFSHTLRLNLSEEFEFGTFNIYVGGATFGSIVSEPYEYYSLTKAIEYAKKIHADFTNEDIMEDEEDRADAVAYFEKSAKLLGFGDIFYEVDADKVASNLAEEFTNSPVDFKDGEKAVAEIVALVDLHSVLEAFRSAKAELLFDANGDLIVEDIVGIEKAIEDNTSLDISDITSAGVSLVNKGIMVPDVEDKEDLAKLYAKNIILQSIKNNNDLGYDFITDVLTEENTQYAGVSVDDYMALSDKSSANEKIIINKDSLTIDNFASKINEYAKAAKGEDNKPSNPPKGGGGGSSSGKVTVVEPIEPKPEEDNHESVVPQDMFTDLGNYTWAKQAVENLASNGVISGMGDGTFNPGGNLTREQAIKIIVLALGLSGTDSNKFADEAEGAWYGEYLAVARANGIANGVGDNAFGIGKSISRQDFVTMLYRAMNINTQETELNFADKDSIKSYSKDAVAYFSANGIVNGYTDGTFKPDNSVKRVEAAKIVYELLARRDG